MWVSARILMALPTPPDDIKDASELPGLTERLIAEGYNQKSIIKIWGANAL